LRRDKAFEDAFDRSVETDGLPSDVASLVKEIIEQLKRVASSSGIIKRKATDELLSSLIDHTRSDGLKALVASRCATSLLGLVEGPKRASHRGRAAWILDSRRPIAQSQRSTWRAFRKSMLPLFRAAFPSDVDRNGKSISYQLIAQGFFRALQSHCYVNGELTSFLDLLAKGQAGETIPEWIARIPIHQYWLQAHLNENNAKATLVNLSLNPLNWVGPIMELDQQQIGALAAIARTGDISKYGSLIMFALQGSKIAGRFRESSLSRVLSAVSPNSRGAGWIFYRGQYPDAFVPKLVSETAEKIVQGAIPVCSSLSTAAAAFLSDNTTLKLPPLRELNILPENAKL